ncbi:MAG: PEGA domain-containing protein [Clostridia bacterium]|jgi:hypothetical protein
MTRFRLIGALVLCLCCAGPVQAQTPEAGGVSFIGFDSSDLTESGRAILADLVRREISLAPGFLLIERQELGSVLAEQELQLSELFEGTGVVSVGKLLGADYVMLGRVGKLGTLYIISLRMIDVARGEVVRAVTEEYLGPIEDLRKPVRIAAQRILGIPGIEVKQGEYISVETEPPGVAVYVNGLFEGNSPVVVRVLKPDRYAVKLASEGYKPWSQNVSVEEASTFFLKARLIQQEKTVDERVKALQDGRVLLLSFLTLYSAAASEATLFALGSENIRLYIGLPLVVSPLSFFGALKLTDGVVMNSGRSLMITSSMLWGSTWGIAAGTVFGLDSGADGEGDSFNQAFAGLSVAGGVLYGGLSYALTMGDEPFPSSRAWLYNLGSVLGAFLGLGVPYVLGFESPGVIYAGMLTGSLAGAGTSLWLTRDFSEGRSIGNLALGTLLELDGSGLRVGLPVPVAIAMTPGVTSQRTGFYLPLASIRY